MHQTRVRERETLAKVRAVLERNGAGSGHEFDRLVIGNQFQTAIRATTERCRDELLAIGATTSDVGPQHPEWRRVTIVIPPVEWRLLAASRIAAYAFAASALISLLVYFVALRLTQ